MDKKLTIEEYIPISNKKFQEFKNEWEKLKKEAPEKFNNLLNEGCNNKVERNSEGGISIKFNRDVTGAKEYLFQLNEQIQGKMAEMAGCIEDIDEKLQLCLNESVEYDLFEKLVKQISEWIDYSSEMGFELWDYNFVFTSSQGEEVKRKWNEELRKYGVSSNTTDMKHKCFDNGVSQNSKDENIKYAILEYLDGHSGMFSLSELMENIFELNDISLPKASKLVKELVEEGLVENVRNGRTVCYRYKG